MTYPENREALKNSRKLTIQDLIDIQYESPIIHSVLALYRMNLVTLEEALILIIQSLHQSNKDLYQMCVDLLANKPPPIVISKDQ